MGLFRTVAVGLLILPAVVTYIFLFFKFSIWIHGLIF